MDICIHNDFCGGCLHQDLSCDKQIELKGKEVFKLLENNQVDLSHMEKPFRIEDTVGAPKQYRYRDKMEYTFGDMVKDGEMTLGMHQKGRFMSIVTVDHCQLVDEDFNVILRSVLDFADAHGYRPYHKKSHEGLMRNLIIRKGERTGELLINIVTSSQQVFDEDGFVKMLLALGGDVTDGDAADGKKINNKIVGILRTINDNIADAVNCEELITLYGRDYYMEKIMGLDFKVSAFSFFQTNIEAVERLYTDAIGFIDDFSGKTVFDLFCGTGTITQAIAHKVKKAIGVELVEEAVLAAKENAKLNRLENCEFIAGDVFKVLSTIEEKPDVIIVDPPRVGIMAKTLEKILNYHVNQILYVSCNPKTMVLNLKLMEEYGYRATKIKVYDNFPMTKHIECVVLMSKVQK